MSDEVKAIDENGVFRPLEPVQWSEQQQVTVRLSEGANVQDNGEQAAAGIDIQEVWTKEKNARRCDLIDKKIQKTITDAERNELEHLQQQLRRRLDKVAPFDLSAARQLHRELLQK